MWGQEEDPVNKKYSIKNDIPDRECFLLFSKFQRLNFSVFMEIIIKILIIIYLSGTGHNVTKTAYSSDINQCDNDPFTARCGPVKECIVAISRDIMPKCGTLVFIPGDYECLFFRTHFDTMAKRKENWIDLYKLSKTQAAAHGIERDQFIFIFNKI